MEVVEFLIKMIKLYENTRVRFLVKDVSKMMASIKEHGLLEPIGICHIIFDKKPSSDYYVVYGNTRFLACEKLGWNKIPVIIYPDMTLKEFIKKNMIENLMRDDLTETERGRAFFLCFKDFKMTYSEISSFTGQSVNRVKNAINTYCLVPEGQRERVSFIKGGLKKGRIPSSAVELVLRMQRKYSLTEKNIEDLLEDSRQDGFSVVLLEIIAFALSNGYSIEEAKKFAYQYKIMSFHVPIKITEIERLKKKYKKSLPIILREILRGELDEVVDVLKRKGELEK